MEPEDSQGKLDFSTTPEHKTNILPLRWFANGCDHLSGFAITRALQHEYFAEYNGTELSKAGYRWWKIWAIINIPYDKWGTTYLIDRHK
jgi:hypothetical protein